MASKCGCTGPGGVDRRDFIKLGAGVGASMLGPVGFAFSQASVTSFWDGEAGAFTADQAAVAAKDILDAARHLVSNTHTSLGSFAKAAITPIDETSSEYLISMDVADRPGVLHAVTGVFARHGVSIRAAEQEGNGPDARLVFLTHVAREADVQATVRELRDLDVVRNVGSLLRVIGH